MGKAVIFLVDDSDVVRTAMKRALKDLGHSVVLEAGSLEEAFEKTENVKELGVNLAILDGSLDWHGDTEDGHRVAEALKKEIPEIIIISNSGSLEPLTWGDYNFDKYKDRERLFALIDTLFK